jgi:TPR repeat protein
MDSAMNWIMVIVVMTILIALVGGLGSACSSAQNIKKTQKKVQRYRQAAEKGDMEAQFGLGLFYAAGLGVEQDDAEQGNAEAQSWLEYLSAKNKLDEIYAEDRGVEQDDAETAKQEFYT